MKLVLFFAVFASVLFAQSDQAIKDALDNMSYPTIASRARVQGDVEFDISDSLRLVIGHPMLVPNSRVMLESLKPQGYKRVVVHFVLVNPGTITDSYETKRSNTLGRFFLRIVGRPTTKTIFYSKCDDSKVQLPETEPLKSLSGKVLHLYKYGVVRCLVTESSSLLASN